MTIEYDPDYKRRKYLRSRSKIIDVDGIEANATKKDLEFSVSNTRLATIDDDGVLKAKKDAEGRYSHRRKQAQCCCYNRSSHR